MTLSTLTIKTVIVHTTTYSVAGQILGLWEVLLQSLLLSTVLFHCTRHPEQAWLTWTLGIPFCIGLVLPVVGLLVTRPVSPGAL